MSTLTPTEFVAQCEQQAREADVEWRGKHPELWMDQCECSPDTLAEGWGCQEADRCQRCGAEDIGLLRRRMLTLTSPTTGTKYHWTLCGDCGDALGAWYRAEGATDA